jgi:hypothetical protein
VVDTQVLGIRLMRGWKYIALVVGVLLPYTSALNTARTAENAGADESVCTGRPLASKDNTAAVLTDCDLESMWAKAGMRAHLEKCAQDGQASGVISFGFALHPGGGIGELEVRPKNSCVETALKTHLAGPQEGKPGYVEGRLVVAGEKPVEVSLSLDSWLFPRRSPVKALPGRLVAEGHGYTSTCSLGSAHLALRLGTMPPSPGPALDPAVEQLVEKCEQNITDGDWESWTRSDWKREREISCKCLTGLLEDADLEVRGRAAEKLAQGRYWKGRRALSAVVVEMMKPPGCQKESECLPVAPRSAQAGLVLVRMLKAHRRLRRWVKDEHLEALARHPSRQVRLHLVGDILKNWRGDLPPVVGILYRDPDPVVRARTCNIGCQRDDRFGREEFLKGLAHARAEIRAATVLYAGSCVEKAGLQVRRHLRKEADPAVALLMLQALPVAPEPLVLKRAGKALLDPCPIVRFLAGKLLRNTKALPKEEVKRALAREPNVALKEQLVDLLGSGGPQSGSSPRLQIWLQFETGKNSPGPKSSK